MPLTDLTSWIITYSFITLGLIAAFIPILPSHLLILGGCVWHWFSFEKSGLGWESITVLSVLLVASQITESLSGSIGSKWFGGTKWGMIGALLGAVVGLFFAPLGFVLGPLIGALLLEWIFGKQKLKNATFSGFGSALGTLSGLLVRMITALLMISYLLLDIYLLQ